MTTLRNRCVLTVTLILCGIVFVASPYRASASDTSYVVQVNDTLSSIALAYGTSVSALMAANDLQDADVINVGQTLVLPSGSSQAAQTGTTSSDSAAATYTVQGGDTLSSIALRYGVSLGDLESSNNLQDNSIIQPGQQVLIPSTGGSAAVAPSTSASDSTDIGSILTTQAQNAGIDPTLVKAVAWQESGWQMITASDGGIGVMQLMPDSVDWVSNSLLGYSINPYDPTDNIRAGVAMLRYYLNLFGDVTDAVAAYHQGMVSVETQGISAETQHYVDNVLALQQRFGG